MGIAKLQFVVSTAIAAGKCKPQVSVRGLPTHKSGSPRSSQVTSTLTFTVKKDGKDVPAALYIADNGGCHEGHQTGLQAETFARIFNVLAKYPGKVVNVQAELTDNDGAQESSAPELNELFG